MPPFEQDAIKIPIGKDTIEVFDRFGEYIPTDTTILETSNGLEWLWIFGVVIIVLGIIIIRNRISIKYKGDQNK